MFFILCLEHSIGIQLIVLAVSGMPTVANAPMRSCFTEGCVSVFGLGAGTVFRARNGSGRIMDTAHQLLFPMSCLTSTHNVVADSVAHPTVRRVSRRLARMTLNDKLETARNFVLSHSRLLSRITRTKVCHNGTWSYYSLVQVLRHQV
jgi:hypothetical protein